MTPHEATTQEKLYRYVDTIFCDDIRNEDSGKLLVVGMYGSELVVNQQAPVLLPSLVLFIRAKTTVDQPFRKFTTRVWFDDELVTETAVDEASLNAAAAKLSEDSAPDSENRVHMMQAIARMSPFPILRSGTLRVRVETESEILKAGALTIRVLEDSTSKTAQDENVEATSK